MSGLSFPVIIIFLVKAVASVDIKRFSVPRWVQNGTEESVLLDCEYVYSENDIRLVVKWFFNESRNPVYQWIPELGVRHSSGILQGRLDEDFAVNTLDTYSRYRALRIRNPTTELSGKYTCLVTSLADQDSREQEMTVYVPAKYLWINYTENSDSSLTVKCLSGGTFPAPKLTLFIRSSLSPNPVVQSDVQKEVKKINSTYDVSIEKYYRTVDLSREGVTTFQCLLEIPGTGYRLQEAIDYYSDEPKEEEDSTEDCTGIPN